MTRSSLINKTSRRHPLVHLLCVVALFSAFVFLLQSSFFSGSQRIGNVSREDVETLNSFQSSVQQCVANRGLGLTAHIVDHCKLIMKFPEGTNSTWYNAQFKIYEPLEYSYDVCEAILLWEQYRNMTTILTREYLDVRPDGWLEYAAKRIAQLGADRCYNRSLCEENLNMTLPGRAPFHPRQFRTCAVVGNSGDLLKTEFGEEIDSHDAVIRDNEAPVNDCAVQLKTWFRFSMVHLMRGAKGTGMKSVELALSMCDIVDIYGFTVDPGYTEWTRYFSEPKKGHNPLQGRAYYQLLECLGVIRIHSPMRSQRKQDWSDVPSREMIRKAHSAALRLKKDQADDLGQFSSCKVWGNVDPSTPLPVSGSPDMSEIRKSSNYNKWEILPVESLRKEARYHYKSMEGVSLYKMDGNKLDDLVCIRHSEPSSI